MAGGLIAKDFCLVLTRKLLSFYIITISRLPFVIGVKTLMFSRSIFVDIYVVYFLVICCIDYGLVFKGYRRIVTAQWVAKIIITSIIIVLI